jgi:Nuclease-related domain
LNYARRRQYRRLSRAAMAAMASGAIVLLALSVASVGAVSTAGALLIPALGLGFYARHWLSLARRSGVGARSEDEVRRVLERLEGEGWRLRHSLPWRGPEDVDAFAIAPNGVGFVIEIKTRTYDDRHLARVREQAAWLSRRRRRGCRRGAVRWSAWFAHLACSSLSRTCSSCRSISWFRCCEAALAGSVGPPANLGMRRLFGRRGRIV